LLLAVISAISAIFQSFDLGKFAEISETVEKEQITIFHAQI